MIADINASEILFLVFSVGGIVFGVFLLVILIVSRRKERAIEHRIEAILNGRINSYEDYLLYKLNLGEKKENFALSYEDYLMREIDRGLEQYATTRKQQRH